MSSVDASTPLCHQPSQLMNWMYFSLADQSIHHSGHLSPGSYDNKHIKNINDSNNNTINNSILNKNYHGQSFNPFNVYDKEADILPNDTSRFNFPSNLSNGFSSAGSSARQSLSSLSSGSLVDSYAQSTASSGQSPGINDVDVILESNIHALASASVRDGAFSSSLTNSPILSRLSLSNDGLRHQMALTNEKMSSRHLFINDSLSPRDRCLTPNQYLYNKADLSSKMSQMTSPDKASNFMEQVNGSANHMFSEPWPGCRQAYQSKVGGVSVAFFFSSSSSPFPPI